VKQRGDGLGMTMRTNTIIRRIKTVVETMGGMTTGHLLQVIPRQRPRCGFRNVQTELRLHREMEIVMEMGGRRRTCVDLGISR